MLFLECSSKLFRAESHHNLQFTSPNYGAARVLESGSASTVRVQRARTGALDRYLVCMLFYAPHSIRHSSMARYYTSTRTVTRTIGRRGSNWIGEKAEWHEPTKIPAPARREGVVLRSSTRPDLEEDRK